MTTGLEEQNAALVSANADLRRTNEALVLSGGKYLVLHDLAPPPLVTLDSTGRITDVNQAAETMLGSERSQLLDKLFSSFFDAKYEAQLAELFATSVERGLEASLSRGGTSIDLQISAVALPGIPQRVILACVDLTARKHDEAARLLATQRTYDAHRLDSLSVLAGGVAQNVNNLMTVVLAVADHVLSELPAGSSHIGPLTEARQAARQAGDLAHQMLAFSGRVSVPVHPVDLGNMIRNLEPLLRASARSTRVVLELAEQVPFVAGDVTQLRQALLDVVINAAEAMTGRGGVITIGVRVADSRQDGKAYVRVEVRDDGDGMSPATKARIFDPYFSTRSAGRGLGLAAVHGVVRAHGGEIAVESNEGRGTSVSFLLPTIVEPVEPVEAPADSGWMGDGTVLVVDDEEPVRRVLKRALTKLGCDVVLVGSGQAALDALRERGGTFNLVITDLTMPEMDGCDLARVIRADYPDLPIVLITGYGELPADSVGLFTAALSKPFGISALTDVVRSALGKVTI